MSKGSGQPLVNRCAELICTEGSVLKPGDHQIYNPQENWDDIWVLAGESQAGRYHLSLYLFTNGSFLVVAILGNHPPNKAFVLASTDIPAVDSSASEDELEQLEALLTSLGY